jgi:hypothetical protein
MSTATFPAEITYLRLRNMAEMYEDHQKTRIAQENRIRALEEKPEDDPRIKQLQTIESGSTQIVDGRKLKSLRGILIEEYRRVVPAGIIEWQKENSGIGEHTLARLLGHLGHPRFAQPKYWEENPELEVGEFGDEENPKKVLQDGEPFERTIGQLWQYCGHGRAERYRKGMTQDEAMQLGRPRCKMITYLLAKGIIMAQIVKTDDNGGREALGELGEFYLAEKLRYHDRTHSGPCSGGYVSTPQGKALFAKCKTGVDGSYAIEGDPYTDGHVNAIVMRHLGKEILRDLWIAAGE